MVERKLGRGLDFLIKKPTTPEVPKVLETASETRGKTMISVEDLVPNPFQPRRVFDIEELNQLIESVRLHGVLQPVAVRQAANGFELIAGERRWRASRELGLETIPAVIHEVSDQKMLELALIENLQREDLDPIEKAKAYRQLMREFNLTQEEASKQLSIKRSTVANHLRLLDLPREIQELVSSKRLSMGHARALLAAPSPEQRLSLAKRAVAGELTVRDVERLASASKQASELANPGKPSPKQLDPNLEDYLSRLRSGLGTKVTLRGTAKRGKITIDYFDANTLNHLLEAIEATPARRSEAEQVE
ncbi:MAG: ParB/RepB/Spo0J family partition protein [Planctomycetota bacterium]